MSENTSTNPEKYKTITIMSESTPTDTEKYTKNYHNVRKHTHRH
jgi:hypothetical protein